MADKSIGELPQAQKVLPESLIPLEQDGQAMRMSGEQFSDFAKESVSPLAQQAEDSANTATEAANTAEAARDSIVLDEQKMAQAVREAEDAAQTAQNAASSAGASQTAAQQAHTAAESAQTAAQQAASDAQSAQTAAKTSAAEAESAAVRAENAAGTVESIVAGNEAYTKRESDLRFAVPIVEGASGSVVTVTDSAERPLQGLKVFGKTIQNGTPTPDAPIPLESVGGDGDMSVTVCGKNLIPYYLNVANASVDGVAFTIQPDGGVKASIAVPVTKHTDFRLAGSWENETPIFHYKAGQTFTISFCENTAYHFRLASRQSGKWEDVIICVGASMVWTPSEDGYITDIFCTCIPGFDGDAVGYPQIELGDTASKYEQPKPTKTLTVQTPNGLPGIPVTSGGNYTDESGQQWICDEVDFARGVRVQRFFIYDFTGTETITPFDSGIAIGGTFVQLGIPKIKIITAQSVENVSNALCNAAEVGTQKQVASGQIGLGFSLWDSIIYYYFNSAVFGTPEELKAAMKTAYENGTPYRMIYELAEPIETPLTAEELAAYAALHTNYPNTTVFNDGGAGMEVAYAADTKMYIDNKFAQLAAAIVNNT